jgi:hypothetical protein
MPDVAGRVLTLEETMEIISKAKAGGSSPVVTMMQIFRGLSENVTVSGDVLRLALTASASSIGGPFAPLLNALLTISKTADHVAITNSQKVEAAFNGNRVRLGEEVSFDVGGTDGEPALNNIAGVAAHKVGWISIENLELKHSQGHLKLAVVTRIGTIKVDLGEEHA